MIAKGAMVTAGGMAFAESSHPEDELFIIAFNERVRHALPPTQPFTQSRPLVRATLAGLSAGGKTALYDAVIEALDHVEKATHQKHVIIVLSDGDDNASLHSKEEMYDRAARSDAIIYTVATSDPRLGGGGSPGVLRRLAEIGGGMASVPRSREQVVTVLMEMAENIRRGYSVGYVPTNTARDGRFRKVKVMVRANGKSLDVRTRDGYTAPGPASTK
jgi:Ca-activated chloride channel family protein